MSKQTVKGLWRRIFGALLTLSMLASLMPMTSSAAQKSNPPRSLGFSVSGSTVTVKWETPDPVAGLYQNWEFQIELYYKGEKKGEELVPTRFRMTWFDPINEDSDSENYGVRARARQAVEVVDPDVSINYMEVTKWSEWSVWVQYGNVGAEPPAQQGLYLDDNTFPSLPFRQYLRENADQDRDEFLSEEEVAAVTVIDLSLPDDSEDAGADTLKGIEHFVNLEELYVRNNAYLAELDLSQNTRLKKLDCGYTSISALDLSKHTGLTMLDCSYTDVNSLDVTNNPELETLRFAMNGYGTYEPLDLSKNPKLKELDCTGQGLSSLDVSNNPALVTLLCANNNLTTLDVSKNTKLQTLDCSENRSLEGLDLSYNSELKTLILGRSSDSFSSIDLSHNPLLEVFESEYIEFANLDFSANPNLKKLYLAGYSGETIGIAENTGLQELLLSGGDIASLDLSGHTQLTNLALDSLWYLEELSLPPESDTLSLLDIYYVGYLPEIDLSKYPNLTAIRLSEVDLAEIDVSNNTKLLALDISRTEVAALDVSGNSELEELYLSETRISSLDLSNNPKLFALEAYSLPDLAELDLSNNPELMYLDCSGSGLAELDLTNAPGLAYLDCSETQLKTLDLSKCTALVTAYCNDCDLEALDVSGCEALTYLRCYNNRLTSLQLHPHAPVWGYNFEAEDNAYDIVPNVRNEFDLSTLPGDFDVNNAEGWSGGTVSGSILTVDYGATQVTYSYHCGNDEWKGFTLNVTSLSDDHPHSFGTEWVYDETDHWHECLCGERQEETPHSYGGGTGDACTVCGYVRGTSLGWPRALTPGLSLIDGAQADNVYFGSYQQGADGSGGFRAEPVKWRVLSKEDGSLLLLSDKILDIQPYHESFQEDVTWETSSLRKWMNETFYSRAFNASEQGKVMETALENKDNDTYDDVIPGGNATTDKFFALSVDEAHNPAYGFQDNTNWEYLRPSATREAEATDYAGSLFVGRLPEYLEWWLRSPGGKPGYAIAVEASSGEARFYGSKVFTEGLAGYGVRPAFRLNTETALFASAATGGKPEGGLKKTMPYYASDWKLTFLDESRSGFTAACTSYDGGTAVISYSGARTGNNEYISAVIKDNASGVYTHYGRLAQAETAGTATLDLSGIDMAGKALYIFNEQYNGDYQTDYASALKEVSLVSCEHTFGEWIIYRYPTETEPGENKRFCTKCKYAESQITPALGEPCAGEHVYGTEWSFNDLFHWHTCIHCGQRDIGSHRIEGEATECAICRTPVETSTDDFFVYEVTASIYGEDGEWIEDITHTVPLPVERTKEEALQKARDIYLKAVVASEYPDTLWEEQPYEDAPKTNADTGETETDVLISISLDGKSLLRSIYEIHEAKFKVTAVPSVKIQNVEKGASSVSVTAVWYADAVSPAVLAAVYDSAGRMVSMQRIENVESSGKQTVTLPISGDISTEQLTVKLFLWGSLSSMTPLAPCDEQDI